MIESPDDHTKRTAAGPAVGPLAVSQGWLIGLLIIVALGAAWLGYRLWQVSPPAEGSAEVTFARNMMAHHEQAVDMAFILHDRTNDAGLRQFTLDIILTQQAQIGQMYGWLSVWGLPITGLQPPMQGPMGRMGMASQEDVNALRTLPVAETETSFLKLMILHHQGGVMMAQEALASSLRPEVQRLATSIIESQQSEIDFMQQLLAERGVSPIAAPTAMPTGMPGMADH